MVRVAGIRSSRAEMLPAERASVVSRLPIDIGSVGRFCFGSFLNHSPIARYGRQEGLREHWFGVEWNCRSLGFARDDKGEGTSPIQESRWKSLSPSLVAVAEVIAPLSFVISSEAEGSPERLGDQLGRTS